MRPFAIAGGFLLFGLPVMIASGALGRRMSWHPAMVAVPAFILFNLLAASLLDVRSALQSHWAPQTMPLFFAGAAGGAFIGLLPVGLAIRLGQTAAAGQAAMITPTSIVLTLLVVTWEELWFRGMPLNYLSLHSSPVLASAFCGMLFVGVHSMNPEIRLLSAAPNLFLAGFLLSSCYLYFRSIYFPIGLHFAWNEFHDLFGPLMFRRDVLPASPCGENGFVVTVLLAAGSCLLIWSLRRRAQAET
ncbi:MAG: CPBP family intramembrane metalloprotease [Elusimicrobia bacterium]|nr:CPBP family intramembrane metalloprotease [Elusimicrobiota bacterium]